MSKLQLFHELKEQIEKYPDATEWNLRSILNNFPSANTLPNFRLDLFKLFAAHLSASQAESFLRKNVDSELGSFLIQRLIELDARQSITTITPYLNTKIEFLQDQKLIIQAIDAVVAFEATQCLPHLLSLISCNVLSVAYSALKAYIAFKDKNAAIELQRILKQNKLHENIKIEIFEELYKLTGDVKYHRLYVGVDEDFFGKNKIPPRRELDKTGSRTILLGGAQVGKAIVRIIEEPAFIEWKKALEAKEVWKKAGFDYVPVEPILSKGKKLRAYKSTQQLWLREDKEENDFYFFTLFFQKNGKKQQISGQVKKELKLHSSKGDFLWEGELLEQKFQVALHFCFDDPRFNEYYILDFGQVVIKEQGVITPVLNFSKIRVTTKVLGPSLDAFLNDEKFTAFHKKMKEDRHKIIEVLTTLKIEHNHTHFGNFCVGLDTEEPRLYIIDWDIASSSYD